MNFVEIIKTKKGDNKMHRRYGIRSGFVFR